MFVKNISEKSDKVRLISCINSQKHVRKFMSFRGSFVKKIDDRNPFLNERKNQVNC